MARILAQVGVAADGVAVGRPPAEPWHLWPCNVRTWGLWMRLQTQWRTGGMGGQPTGLDYAAVWATLERLGVRRRREVFEHLQAMERAALTAWGERREQEQRRRA